MRVQGQPCTRLMEIDEGYLMISQKSITLAFFDIEENGWLVEEFKRGHGWCLFAGEAEVP